jgi:hypothetical protein
VAIGQPQPGGRVTQGQTRGLQIRSQFADHNRRFGLVNASRSA